MDQYGASSSNDLPGRIRKRRYSTARIQPTRIKKVMQSDEDIGRMVSSVPVAIGSAMEHFAEKLLENAQDVMHKSGSRTLAPAHIFGAIQRTDYLKSFLEPLVNSFGGNGATSSSPVTTPTNGLSKRPFENLSSSSPMNEKYESLSALMRDTAKSHLASNMAAAAAAAAAASTSDEGKRRRGRPKKDEKPNKSDNTSPPNGQESSSSSTVSSQLNGKTKADLDRVLMPPPLMVPQRKIQPPPRVIIPKSMISKSTSNNSTSSSSTTQSSTTTTTMVSSSSNDQISA